MGQHLALRSRVQDLGWEDGRLWLGVYGVGFMVEGLISAANLELGYRTSSVGFRVQGLAFSVEGLGLRVLGLGFRV